MEWLGAEITGDVRECGQEGDGVLRVQLVEKQEVKIARGLRLDRTSLTLIRREEISLPMDFDQAMAAVSAYARQLQPGETLRLEGISCWNAGAVEFSL